MHPVGNRKHSSIVVADLGGTWLKLRAMRRGEVLADEVIHPVARIKTVSPTSSLSHLITGFAQECSLYLLDILVRNDVTRMPESILSGESPVDRAKRVLAPQSVPPALQKGLLR